MDESYANWNIFFFSFALSIYSLYSAYVLYKVKFKVDKSALIMMILYFLGILNRLISWVLFFHDGTDSSNQAILWI